MSNLIPFSFESHSIRTIIIADEIWWVAADVCKALGIQNTSQAVSQLDDDEKQVIDLQALSKAYGNNIKDLVNVINESGLYTLILRSNKQEAKRFKKWVTAEVLPSIRKSGGYHLAPALVSSERPTKVFPEYFRIAKLIGLDKNAAALSANQATFKKTGENVLALMGITHLETEQPWFSPTELGKRLDVSARQFNLLLLESGLQIKEGDHWLPTDAAKGLCRFFDTSKRHMDGTVVQQLKWSGDVLALINREAA